MLGYQYFLKNRISIDLFAGPGYNYGYLKVKTGEEGLFDTTPRRGLTLRFGATLGIGLK